MRYTDPAAVPPIHANWCSCRECRIAAEHAFSRDLRAILYGLMIALAIAAVLIAIYAPAAGS
jgi:hypothetical protein